MATTVFPLTDQIVTKALFDNAKNSIDEGSLDIFTSIRDTQNYETDRKLLNQDEVDLVSNDSWSNRDSSIQVPIGTAWLCRVTAVLQDVNMTSPDDDLLLRVNCDTGVSCRGIAFTKPDGLPASGVTTTYINVTGTTQSFFGKPAINPVSQNHTLIMHLLIVGDTASGVFSIDNRKEFDLYGNAFFVRYSTIDASRIW